MRFDDALKVFFLKNGIVNDTSEATQIYNDRELVKPVWQPSDGTPKTSEGRLLTDVAMQRGVRAGTPTLDTHRPALRTSPEILGSYLNFLCLRSLG